jgi:hypothetical protein
VCVSLPEDNFEEEVLGSEDFWLVEFYGEFRETLKTLIHMIWMR